MSLNERSITPPNTPIYGDDPSSNDSVDYLSFFELKNDNQNHNYSQDLFKDSNEVANDKSHSPKTQLDIKVIGICNCQGEKRVNYQSATKLECTFLNYNVLGNNPFEGFESHMIDLHLTLNLEHYFMKIRKNYQSLMKLYRNSGSCAFTNTSAFKLRLEVVKYFKAIYSYSKTSKNDKETISCINKECENLLNLLGKLQNTHTHVTNAHSPQGNKCSSPLYHLFHFHLDVRWWVLIILHHINEIETVSSLNETSADRCLNILLEDLITLSHRQVAKATLQNLDSIAVGFPCSCSHELALCIVHAVELRSASGSKKGFYSRFSEKLLNTLKPFLENNSNIHNREKITLSHGWWTFGNFAKLFLYDVKGIPVPINYKSEPIKNDPKMLNTLTKLIGKKEQANEMQYRFYLRCCLEILTIWPSDIKSSECIKTFWDHFAKSLDTNFVLKKSNLDEFTAPSQCVLSIINKNKFLLDSSANLQNENSLHLFIRIVVLAIKENTNESRSIKGKIFSKFHAGTLNSFGERGLENTILIFLVLAQASTSDISNLVVRLSNLLAIDLNHRPSLVKLKIIILGHLCSVHLLLSNECNVAVVGKNLASSVSYLVDCYNSASRTADKSDIGKVVTFYFQGVEEVLSCSSNFNLSQEILFCSCLSKIFSKGFISELKPAFDCVSFAVGLSAASSKFLLNSSENRGLRLLSSVWRTFGESLKKHCTSITPETIVGTTLASMAVSFARFSQAGIDATELKDNARNIFQFIFNNSNTVSPRVAIVFICGVLSEEDGLELLCSLMERGEEKLVCQLLSALVSEGNTDALMTAAQRVFALPSIVQLMPQPPASTFAAFEMLFQLLVEKSNSCQAFADRVQFLMKIRDYFCCLKQSVPNLLKRKQTAPHVTEVFSLLGCLFTHGTFILYTKNKPDEILNSLIKSLILNFDKSQQSNLEPLLPKVIVGLGKLNIEKDSEYIQKIFSTYCVKFSENSHPFLKVFDFHSPVRSKLKKIFLSCVPFPYDKQKKASEVEMEHKIVLSLLLELLKRDAEFWLDDFIEILIPEFLNKVLRDIETYVVESKSTDFFKAVFLEVENKQTQRSTIGEKMCTFAAQNIPHKHKPVFEVLYKLARLNKSMIVDILPRIDATVLYTEERRGMKVASLRREYNTLLSALGAPPKL